MENNNENIEDKVKIYIEPAVEFAKILKDKGYIPANGLGERTDDIETDVVGILEPRGPIDMKLFGLIKFKKKQRALFIGELWFYNSARNANHNENWVLEAYGREKVDDLKALVTPLAEKYDVRVDIKLQNEKPKFETLWRDYD